MPGSRLQDGNAKMSDYEWKVPAFGGVFDILDFIFSFGGVLGGCPSMTNLVRHTQEFVIGFLPFIHAHKTLSALDTDSKAKMENMVISATLGGLWITWVVSLIVQDHHQPGWFAFAIAVYTGMAVILAQIRGRVRDAEGIKGGMIEDFIVCFIMYPQAGAQCWLQLSEGADKVIPTDPDYASAQEITKTTEI